MEYFQVMYDSRVVIYEHKMFIRLATGLLVSEATALSTVPQPLPNIQLLLYSVLSIGSWRLNLCRKLTTTFVGSYYDRSLKFYMRSAPGPCRTSNLFEWRPDD